MTDKVWLLKSNLPSGNTTLHGKFFTSPYTAMAKGVRMSMENEALFGKYEYSTEMFGIDIDDVPCDHIAIHSFATEIVTFIHRRTHKHGFVLIEKDACKYEVLRNGETLGHVMIIYLPPLPDVDDAGLGDFVFRSIDADYSDVADLALMVQQFWDTGF